MWQKHEMYANFCYPVLLSNFAQILKHFAQLCDYIIATFRNSGNEPKKQKVLRNHFLQVLVHFWGHFKMVLHYSSHLVILCQTVQLKYFYS